MDRQTTCVLGVCILGSLILHLLEKEGPLLPNVPRPWVKNPWEHSAPPGGDDVLLRINRLREVLRGPQDARKYINNITIREVNSKMVSQRLGRVGERRSASAKCYSRPAAGYSRGSRPFLAVSYRSIWTLFHRVVHMTGILNLVPIEIRTSRWRRAIQAYYEHERLKRHLDIIWDA